MRKHELEKKLKAAGCVLSEHGKRHDKWINPNTGEFFYIPRHAKELSVGVANNAIKKLTEN